MDPVQQGPDTTGWNAAASTHQRAGHANAPGHAGQSVQAGTMQQRQQQHKHPREPAASAADQPPSKAHAHGASYAADARYAVTAACQETSQSTLHSSAPPPPSQAPPPYQPLPPHGATPAYQPHPPYQESPPYQPLHPYQPAPAYQPALPYPSNHSQHQPHLQRPGPQDHAEVQQQAMQGSDSQQGVRAPHAPNGGGRSFKPDVVSQALPNTERIPEREYAEPQGQQQQGQQQPSRKKERTEPYDWRETRRNKKRRKQMKRLARFDAAAAAPTACDTPGGNGGLGSVPPARARAHCQKPTGKTAKTASKPPAEPFKMLDNPLYDVLSAEIAAFVDSWQPCDEIQAARDEVLRLVKEGTRAAFPGRDVTVHVFGSAASGLSTKSSDMDMVLVGLHAPADPQAGYRKRERLAVAQDLAVLRNALKPIMTVKKNPSTPGPKWLLIGTARVPILRSCTASGVAFDVSISDKSGVETTAYFKQQVSQHPVLQPIVLVLKAMLRAHGRKMHDASKGGLSSHGLTCMALAHILEEQKLGSETNHAGQLLHSFLHRYGQRFHLQNQVVSVAHGGVLPRNAPQLSALAARKLSKWKLNRFCILDPATGRNVAVNCQSTPKVMALFSKAAAYLDQRMKQVTREPGNVPAAGGDGAAASASGDATAATGEAAAQAKMLTAGSSWQCTSIRTSTSSSLGIDLILAYLMRVPTAKPEAPTAAAASADDAGGGGGASAPAAADNCDCCMSSPDDICDVDDDGLEEEAFGLQPGRSLSASSENTAGHDSSELSSGEESTSS